jgi:glycosyltransferase involved in cell wall biosynthesis
VAQINIVHGDCTEGGYNKQRILNRLPVTIVAVSEFVRERLVAHGVRDRQIRVIENFLSAERLAATPCREPFRQPGVRRAAVISRLVPEKRIDVLLTCLKNRPELNSIEFHIYGAGPESETLKARAATNGLNVVFEGFRFDVAEQLAQADLLVHLCPMESLGVALLEAMAAGVPVVAPDHGGTGCVIQDGVSGLHFAANDAESLGVCLARLRQAEPERLNKLVAGARAALAARFSERERIADYRSLIRASLLAP